MKSHVCCDFLIPSENVRFGHFKEQIKRQARVILRKKLFVILCSAVRKLNKLSILSLLITNYSSVYSIYLFHLSIYLTLPLVVGVSFQREPCLAEGYSQTWETHFKWEHFCFIEGNRATIQNKKSLPMVAGCYTLAYTYLQNTKDTSHWWWIKPDIIYS